MLLQSGSKKLNHYTAAPTPIAFFCRRGRPVFDAALSRSKLRELELKSARGAETVISTGVSAPE